MRRRVVVSPLLATAAAAALLVSGPVWTAAATTSAEGSFDASFGSGGRMLDWAAEDAEMGIPVDAAVYPDGRVVAAVTHEPYPGDPHNGFGLVRYRSDGTLDTGFGDGGRVTLPLGNGTPTGIALSPDGHIVLVGNNTDTGAGVLARYSAGGEADSSFGTNGARDLLVLNGYTSDVAVQNNGRIVVGGTTGDHMFVARFKTDGDEDTGFGSGGYATAWANNTYTSVAQLVIQPDGKILTVGDETVGAYSGFGLTRWTPAGQLDTGFGSDANGTVATLVGSQTHDHAYAVALLPGGGFVVAGQSQESLANDNSEVAVRYSSAGIFDSSWAEGGRFWAHDYSYGEAARAVAAQRDGKVVLLGDSDLGAGTSVDLVVTRITADGHRDVTFDPGGDGIDTAQATVDFARHADFSLVTRVLRNGRIVVVGDSVATYGMPAAARFLGDLTAPASQAVALLPRYSLGRVTLLWAKGSDDNTGVHNYDVYTQSTLYNAASPGPAYVLKAKISQRKLAISRRAGRTGCFVLRARDYAGNLGAPGSQVCTAFPVDDRSAHVVHGSWTSTRSPAAYRGTLRSSTTAGSALSLKASFRHLAVIASTCPVCGKVKVYLGKHLLKTLSLRSAKPHSKVVLPVAASSSIRSGTVRLVQASGGKRVTVDGVGVSFV